MALTPSAPKPATPKPAAPRHPHRLSRSSTAASLGLSRFAPHSAPDEAEDVTEETEAEQAITPKR